MSNMKKRQKPKSPLPWRVDRDHEIIDAKGMVVAWGYHEDFGALLQKIKRSDARFIVDAANRMMKR